jgi:two-component system CheB/CheR fusion protein
MLLFFMEDINPIQRRIREDHFTDLADLIPIMIWKVDTEGSATYVNKTWVDFTAMTFEESLGFGWGNAVHPDDRDKEIGIFMSAFEKRTPFQSKFRLRRADGQYRWVLSQGNVLYNPDFAGYIGSLTDITDQELAQQATKILMQKKDEFMSVASHELKTPITSMKAALQIVERLTLSDAHYNQIKTFIEKANKQVNKLTDLVEDLLDVTKIHAGKMIFSSTDFCIDEVVRDCVDQIQHHSNSHQIVISGATDVAICADKHRIEQVIINFLSNAIKYSPEADRVLINLEKEQDFLKISITDFGIGIPADKIHYIFDRFFRVQESSQKFSGLGLGLFISSEIVKRHKGDIGVESKEGTGSTFWFTLPLSKKQKVPDVAPIG